MSLKDDWNKVDDTCYSCGAVTKRQKGLTRQNVHRLFKFKFDTSEVIITTLILMFVLLSFVYQVETQASREWIQSMAVGKTEASCNLVCSNKCHLMYTNITTKDLNISNFSLKNGELNTTILNK